MFALKVNYKFSEHSLLTNIVAGILLIPAGVFFVVLTLLMTLWAPVGFLTSVILSQLTKMEKKVQESPSRR